MARQHSTYCSLELLHHLASDYSELMLLKPTFKMQKCRKVELRNFSRLSKRIQPEIWLAHQANQTTLRISWKWRLLESNIPKAFWENSLEWTLVLDAAMFYKKLRQHFIRNVTNGDDTVQVGCEKYLNLCKKYEIMFKGKEREWDTH